MLALVALRSCCMVAVAETAYPYLQQPSECLVDQLIVVVLEQVAIFLTMELPVDQVVDLLMTLLLLLHLLVDFGYRSYIWCQLQSALLPASSTLPDTYWHP